MSTLLYDDLAALMRRANVPLTRQNYIDLAYGNTPPVPWTAEDESDLPEELQNWAPFNTQAA